MRTRKRSAITEDAQTITIYKETRQQKRKAEALALLCNDCATVLPNVDAIGATTIEAYSESFEIDSKIEGRHSAKTE